MKIKMLRIGSPWRTVALVIALAAADILLSLMNLGIGLDTGIVPEEPDAVAFVRYAALPVLAPLGAGALIWRRRFPRTVAVAAAVIGALSCSGIAFIVAIYLLAKRRLDWWVAAIIVLAIGAEEFLGIEPLGWEGMALGLVVLAAITVWGAYRGQRARLRESQMASLKERAEQAEARHTADVEHSRLSERHRIAREMHDTLAHRMSLVAVQAAALQVDAPDTETANAAKVIRETAHAALGELRDVLDVLHEDGTSAAGSEWTALSPGLAPGGGSAVAVKEPSHSRTTQSRMAPSDIGQIAGLVQEWRQAGIAIDYSPSPELASAIPDAVSRAAYRVVQEGITNVCRHAPGAKSAVTLTTHPVEAGNSELDILVVNDRPSAIDRQLENNHLYADGSGEPVQPAPGAGLGLVGLAERVRLLGGTLRHGPVKSGFELQAVIPIKDENGGSVES